MDPGFRRDDGVLSHPAGSSRVGHAHPSFRSGRSSHGVEHQLVREAIDEAEPWLVPAASSQIWSVLRHIRRDLPEVPVYYSIDVRAQLDLLMENLRREEPPDGVSCRQQLLDADTIRTLRRAGMAIIAWTVDDPERARELVEQGVAAITTHEVEDIREAIRGPR